MHTRFISLLFLYLSTSNSDVGSIDAGRSIGHQPTNDGNLLSTTKQRQASRRTTTRKDMNANRTNARDTAGGLAWPGL